MTKRKAKCRLRPKRNQRRGLHIERLEDRRLLACDIAATDSFVSTTAGGHSGGRINVTLGALDPAIMRGSTCVVNTVAATGTTSFVFNGTFQAASNATLPTTHTISAELVEGSRLLGSGTVTPPANSAAQKIYRFSISVPQDMLLNGRTDATINLNLRIRRTSTPAGTADDLATFSMRIDLARPSILSVTRDGSTPTNSDELSFTTTFSEGVSNVNADDFVLTGSGSAGGVISVSQTSASVYRVTVSGIENNNGPLGVALSGTQDVTDLNGNVLTNTTPSSTEAYTLDNVRPTTLIENTPAETEGVFTARIKFSEDVSAFDLSDIALLNGTATILSAVNPSTYDIQITPNGNGDISIDVPAGGAKDEAGNDNLAASRVTVKFNNPLPTVTILNAPTITNKAFSVVIQFSERVVGFGASDILVGNGSVTPFPAIDGDAYTVEITPNGNGDITIDVPAGVAQDVDGGNNLASTRTTVLFDNLGPLIAIQNLPAVTRGVFSATFQFNEPVTGFTLGDVAATGGSVSNFVGGDGNTFTADITPDGSGDVTINVTAGAATDAAGNASMMATPAVVRFDNVAPSLAIENLPAVTNGVFSATFRFSEPVTGFALSDIMVSGGAPGNLVSADARTFTADITPDASGDISINVAGGAATDAAGNASTAATPAIVRFDNEVLTVSINGAPVVTRAIFSVTFQFSDPAVGFFASDVVISRGVLSNFQSVDGDTFTADVTPDGSGDVTIDIPAASATDAAGNPNVAAQRVTVGFDGVAPRIASLVPANDAVNVANDANLQLTFTETILRGTGNIELRRSDDDSLIESISLAGAAISVAGSVLTINPVSDLSEGISVYVLIPSTAILDAAGNSFAGVADKTIFRFTTLINDRVIPTVQSVVRLSPPTSPTNADAVTFRVTFSEAVTGVAAVDFVLSGSVALAANITSVVAQTALVYDITANGLATSNGSLTLGIAPGADIRDVADNRLDPARPIPIATFVLDHLAPTFLLAPQRNTVADQSPINVLVSASEPVTGFSSADISVANATLANFVVVDAQNFAFDVVPNGSGRDISIAIAAGVATDIAGNPNTASAPVVITTPLLILDVIDVAPDPRATAVSMIDIVFSKPINASTLTVDDITLTRDGQTNALPSSITVTSVSETVYRIGGLDSVTVIDGAYQLTVAAANINDTAGNAGTGSASDAWILQSVPPTIGLEVKLDTADDNGLANNDRITSINDNLTFSGTVTGADRVTVILSGDQVSETVEAVVAGDGTFIAEFSFDTQPAGVIAAGRYDVVVSATGGPLSVQSTPIVVVVDRTSPKLVSFTTNGQTPLRLRASDLVMSGSALPVPMTANQRPTIEFQVSDQQYRGVPNPLRLELLERVGSSAPSVLASRNVTIPAAAATDPATGDSLVVLQSLQPTLGLAAGDHVLLVRVTDAAGQVSVSRELTVSVVEVGDATLGSPGTPVLTETFFIGANVLEVRPSQNQIVVDQPIPTGYAINITASTTPIRVVNSVTNSVTGRTTLTLKLASADTLSKVKLNDKVAWLRPWQMSFDKSTQTVWFTMEDGHHLGQFDPATGSVEIHDVSIPSAVVRNADGVLVPTEHSKPTAFDPHGVFFDFDTHLTPRVWFVYRNQVEGGVGIDDAPEESVNNEILRVSYYDVARKKLFTFDFNEIAGVFDIEAHHDDETTSTGGAGGGGGGGGGGANGGGGGATTQTQSESSEGAIALKVGHAVFVDTKGSVWITAEDSGTIVELNFDNPPGGNRPATLNNLSAKTTAHVIPKSFGSDPSISSDFHVHGVQSIVDDRDGSTYVWMVSANVKGGDSTQRLALLLPGETDQWYEFAVPRITGGGSHLLFTAFDDNETPGLPEDDRLIFTDSGFSFTFNGDGIVATMEVGEIIHAIQQGRDVTQISPRVRSIQIPKIPGAAAGSAFSGPNQSFVDRGGTTFLIDPQGGVARVNLDELSDAQWFTADAVVSKQSQMPQHTRITLREAATTATLLKTKLDVTTGADPARSVDRSQMDGVDQYEVATTALRRGNGEGPFRGALNAANTLYGSISQSDHLSTTVFAESARRQMSAVVSPLASPSGAITQARMAFQVLRNGSLVLTARGDAKIVDGQMNLLGKMVTDNRITSTAAADYLIAGEASAVTMSNGSVHVMGRSPRGGVVQYSFTPDGNDWAHADLFNTANWTVTHRQMTGVILAEDTVPAGRLGFSATTSDGHWIAIPIDPNGAIRDLTLASGNVNASRVYSAVAVTLGSDGVLFGYGTNQTGNLIEYRIDDSTVTTRQINAESRETRVMRNVRALTLPNGIRHVFATDGTSRLVHYTIDSSGVQQENISQQTADNGQNFGYFPFQQPFTGRVYTYVAPLVEDDGTIRVYGTNGGDLIEFTRENGVWRVANLTSNTNATFGDNSLPRIPANSVFGGPTAYVDANGGRHILQINAQGEVIEYYTFGDKLFPNTPVANQINSQNVNFFTAKSSTALSNELPRAVLDAVVFLSPRVAPVESVLTPFAVAAPKDVNRDGVITALDALLVINYLSRLLSRPGAERDGSASATDVNLAFDVNGDKSVTPLDALHIINHVARESRRYAQAAAEAQYESAWNEDERAAWEWSVDDVINDLSTQLF